MKKKIAIVTMLLLLGLSLIGNVYLYQKLAYEKYQSQELQKKLDDQFLAELYQLSIVNDYQNATPEEQKIYLLQMYKTCDRVCEMLGQTSYQDNALSSCLTELSRYYHDLSDSDEKFSEAIRNNTFDLIGAAIGEMHLGLSGDDESRWKEAMHALLTVIIE